MLILTFFDSTLNFDLGLLFFLLVSHFSCIQDGCTPLYEACREGHEKIVEMLVTGGADVNVKNRVRRRVTVRLGLSCRGSKRMELGGVLWLISVVTSVCQLLSGKLCDIIFVNFF